MFAKPEDLLTLGGDGGRRFEELLFDLVVMEASRHGIPPSAVRWDHRTSVPDGGRDVVVEATHTDPVRFIPQRPSIWSAKSGKDGTAPSTLRREVVTPCHGAVRRHLEGGNPYVWCTLQPMGTDDVDGLKRGAASLPTGKGAVRVDPALILFQPLENLCAILNDHPGLIPKHLPGVARRYTGVLTLPEWEQEDQQGFAVPWVEFASRSSLVDNVRAHLRARSGTNVLHLAGLSGVGKTRTVLEACRGERDLSGLLYVPRHEAFSEEFLRHLTRSENLIALVVVDEVPLEELRALSSRVGSHAHRLRFVTIGPAHQQERSRPAANILIVPEPQTREGVFRVVLAAGRELSSQVQDSIAHHAAHDLRLALMLVEATRQNGDYRDLPIKDGREVWHRITDLFRGSLGNLEEFRANYPYLTVSIDIGIGGHHHNELQALADRFDLPPGRLDEAAGLAERCGLGIRTPGFFEPIPRALAGHLFREFVWVHLRHRVQAVLRDLPERLLRRIVERCQECVGPERDVIEEAVAAFFFAELGPPDISGLVDRDRSRLFQAWAEFDPVRGLSWLRAAVDQADDQQLQTFHGQPDGSGGWQGRRQVVWLCEHLACFGEHFSACEAILFRLAQVETEPAIGNNSTETWRGLFLPILAFTEVPFPSRASLLLERLTHANDTTLSLAFSAVVAALGSPGGRMAPPTVVGGRVVPEPWVPETWTALRDLQRDLGTRALEAVGRLPGALSRAGRMAVISSLHYFVRLDLIDEVRAILTDQDEDLNQALRLRLREVADRRQAGQGQKSDQRDEVLERLRRWQTELQPTDLAGRARDLTALDYWSAMRDSPEAEGAYGELAREFIGRPEVLAELADWFESDRCKSAFQFGLVFGTVDKAAAAAPLVQEWLSHARCEGFVGGYLLGLATQARGLPSEWQDLLDRVGGQHAVYAVAVTASADVSVRGFRRVLDLVAARAVPTRACGAFGMPEWRAFLGEEAWREVLDLLLRLAGADPTEALGTAVSLGVACTDYGKRPPGPELADAVAGVLRAALTVRVDARGWAWLAEALVPDRPTEAADLLADALTSPGPSRVYFEEPVLEILIGLARNHPGAVMDAVGRQLLDPARRPYFGLACFTGLFDAVGLDEVRRWLTDQGAELVRYVARHLSSPWIEGGAVVIPPVTDWVLTEFSADDQVFQRFCMGRHDGEVKVGHARDRRAALEKELEPFRDHPTPWVKAWIDSELAENDRDAEIDELMDDRIERM